MNVITPFIKSIDGSDGVPIELILWDYSFRASMYKSFLCMTDDYLEYTAVRFERLSRYLTLKGETNEDYIRCI